jgi:hypothetical protein
MVDPTTPWPPLFMIRPNGNYTFFVLFDFAQNLLIGNYNLLYSTSGLIYRLIDRRSLMATPSGIKGLLLVRSSLACNLSLSSLICFPVSPAFPAQS